MPADQNQSSSAALSGVNPSITPGVTSGINPQVTTTGVTDFLSSAMNPGTTDQTSPEGQIAPSPFEELITAPTPVVGQQGDFDVGAISAPPLGEAYVDTQYQSEPPLDASSMPASQNQEPIMSESGPMSGNFLGTMSEVMPINSASVAQDPVVSEPVVQVSDTKQFPPQESPFQESPQESPFQESGLQNIQESPFQEQKIQEQELQDTSMPLENPSLDAGSQQIEQLPMNTQDATTADSSSVGQDSAQGESPQEDQNLNPATPVLMDEPTPPASQNAVIVPPIQENQNLNPDAVMPQDIVRDDSGIPQGPLLDSPFTDAEYKYEDQIATPGGAGSESASSPDMTEHSGDQVNNSALSGGQDVGTIDTMSGERSLESIVAENTTSENTMVSDSISSDDNTSDIISSDAPNTPDIAMQEPLSPAVESSVDEQSSDLDSLGDNSSQDESITQQSPEDVSQEISQDSTQESTIQPSSDISSADMMPQEPVQEIPQDVISESLVSEPVISEAVMSESAMIATEPLTEPDTPEPLEEEMINPTAVSPVEGSTILPIVSDVIGEQFPTDDHHGMPVTNAFYALGDSLKQLVQLGARDATTPYILQGYNDEQTHIHYAFELIDGGNSMTITKTTTSLGDPIVDILGFAYDIMDFSLKVSLDGSEIYKEYEGGPSDVARQQLLLEKLGHFQSMVDEQVMTKQQELEQQRQQAQAELEQQRKLQEDATRVSQQIQNF